MRHSFLRSARLALFCAVPACAASGTDDRAHGPAFDLDAGDARATLDGAPDGAPAGDADATDGASPFVDGGGDAPADAPPDTTTPDAGNCSAKTAVVGAGAASFYQALAVGRGAFTVGIVGVSTGSPGALTAVSGGFLAATRSTNDLLVWTAAPAASWSALAQSGAATTTAAPAVAAVGADVHVVYLGSNGKYYHGTYSGGAWDAASDPVGGAGAAQSFGPSAVGMAAVGGALLLAHRGGTSAQLYAEGWSAGTWSAAPVATAQVAAIPPAVVPMSGASDAMIAYVHDADFKVSWATRAGGAWTDHGGIDATFFTNARPALAPLAGGKAVLAFVGTDGKGYATTFDGAAWSKPPTPLGTATLGGPPALAPGVCGDDAIAALPAAGDAQVLRSSGGAWSAPDAIVGMQGATSISVATSP
jgi:hypothetical protein